MDTIRFSTFVLIGLCAQSAVKCITELEFGPFRYFDSLCIPSLSSRVNGGDNDIEFPFDVSLQVPHKLNSSYYEHVFGGSMIGQKLVLTGAHVVWDEVVGYDYRSQQLSQAELELDMWAAIAPLCRHQGGLGRFKVKKYYIPEQYDGNVQNGYDIAILVLEESSTIYDGPYPDITEPLNADDIFTVVGHGSMNEQEENNRTLYRQSVRVAQKLNLKYQGKTAKECGAQLAQDQFCVVYVAPNYAGLLGETCKGDSGSPLLLISDQQDYQVGIMSWGIGHGCTGREGSPGAYTNIATHAMWIQSVLQSEY